MPCTPRGTRLYSQSYHTMIAVRAVTLRAARRDAPPRQRRDGRCKSLAKGALCRVAEPARKLAHVSRQHLRVHSHIAELRLSQLGEVQEVVVAEVLWRTAYVLTNTQHNGPTLRRPWVLQLLRVSQQAKPFEHLRGKRRGWTHSGAEELLPSSRAPR